MTMATYCNGCGAILPYDGIPGTDRGRDLCATCWATERRYPAPLPGHAYYGVLGELTRIIAPHSEADAAAIYAQLIAATGCLFGRRGGWKIDADFHPCQVWPLIVGDSATARKGTSWAAVRRVVDIVAPGFRTEQEVSGLSSGEGLLALLQDPAPPEGENADAPPPREKRVLVVSAEMARLLRVAQRDGNIITEVLRDLWESGRGQTITRNAPLRVRGAHPVLISHITRADLARFLTFTDTANGFLNRFVLIAARRSRLLAHGGSLDDGDLLPDALRLRDAIDAVQLRPEGSVVLFTDDAHDAWDLPYALLEARRDHLGLAGLASTRGPAQTRRIATTLALANGEQRVGIGAMAAALAVWCYCEQSALWALGDATGDPDADKLARILREHGEPMDREALRQRDGRHMAAERMDAALALLARRGEIEVYEEPTGGRPRKLAVWCAKSAESAESPLPLPPHLSALLELSAQYADRIPAAERRSA